MYTIMRNYPTIEELLSKAEGEKLLEVKRSLRSILSGVALFLGSLILVIVINIFFHESSLPLRWLGLIPLGVLVEIVRRYHDDLYVIEKHRVTNYSGRLSLNYNVPSVRFVDLRAINVRQDILGRIINYGNVELGTAAKDDVEMCIRGVIGPYELSLLIDELRSRSRDSESKTATSGEAIGPEGQAQAHND